MNENVIYINAKSNDADIARFIENLRTRRFVIGAEQPEIVRLGKWESYLTKWTDHEFWRCSACKEDVLTNGADGPYFTNYCPNCGAKMDEERLENIAIEGEVGNNAIPESRN